ncbi:hypothetical protein M2175_006993 [Bradyrhizobium elkanii]|nr:hypothetical protein [Bradyrhizobium elkanii]MCS3972520.1 hypothetical protein [Bradyrhizobium japonicum]
MMADPLSGFGTNPANDFGDASVVSESERPQSAVRLPNGSGLWTNYVILERDALRTVLLAGVPLVRK